MRQPKVLEVKSGDKEKVLSTACLAFCADPFVRWIMPEGQSYLDKYRELIEIYCYEKSLQYSTTFMVERFAGTAIWLPPGVFGNEQKISDWISENVLPEKLETFEEVLDEMEKYNPKDNRSWYLAVLAVDPAFQRRGLGSTMMKHVNRILDEKGCQGFLETSNPKNISLYQRHGYEIMGEIKVGDCPIVTPMIRKPN